MRDAARSAVRPARGPLVRELRERLLELAPGGFDPALEGVPLGAARGLELAERLRDVVLLLQLVHTLAIIDLRSGPGRVDFRQQLVEPSTPLLQLGFHLSDVRFYGLHLRSPSRSVFAAQARGRESACQ